MRMVMLVAALAWAGCGEVQREFRIDKASPPHVAYSPPPPINTIGHSHEPYRGKPAYLASARPLLPTVHAPPQPECAQRSQKCDDRLRALLASLDGEVLALSTPPTQLELQALQLSLAQIQPLLVPYPDMTSERDELAHLVDVLPSQTEVDQQATRHRMTELSDLLRVQLAAAQ
jgi:hypothetical protein